MKILISAAETSSDAHAAELLRALSAESSETIEASGIGGPKLLAAGQKQWVDARELLAMGFGEILSRLPRIFRALRTVEERCLVEKPEVAVFLDYPDFHFRLAKRLARQRIPLIYYIPPKVWVWRQGRVKFLRKFFQKILCILPFEEQFYRQSRVAVSYVGNPLQDELPWKATREDARLRLNLDSEDLCLAVLVGSRPAELQSHLEVFLEAAERVARELREKRLLAEGQRLQVLIPFAETSDLELLKKRIESLAVLRSPELSVRISQGNSAWVMRAADVGLIKSGTSTLEAALLELPHVIAYRPSGLTCFIVKNLIRYRGAIGLSNLVAQSQQSPHVFPELTCCQVSPGELAGELMPLFEPSFQRHSQEAAIRKVRNAVLREGQSPSHLAAQEVLALVGQLRGTAQSKRGES